MGFTRTVLKEGTGRTPAKGEVVRAHYVGRLKNGKEFDNSRARKKPLNFVIGIGSVIKGWDEVIVSFWPTFSCFPLLFGCFRWSLTVFL